MTDTDLAEHRTVVGPAVRVPVADAEAHAAPPVSQAVLAPLAVAARSRAARNAGLDEHLLIEAMEELFRVRHELARGGVSPLVNSSWAPAGGPARRLGGASGTSHTTSVAVADADGLVVSLLVSVFHDFGSACYVPELGVFLNDRLLGLRDTGGPDEQRRPLHTLSPLILVRGDAGTALATPGADAQVQVLAQILNRVLLHRVSIDDALAEARWRLQDRSLLIEEGLPTAALLASLGHNVVELPPLHASFGAVTAAGRGVGMTWAAADGRRSNHAAAL